MRVSMLCLQIWSHWIHVCRLWYLLWHGTKAMLTVICFSDCLICCQEKFPVHVVFWVTLYNSKELYFYSFYCQAWLMPVCSWDFRLSHFVCFYIISRTLKVPLNIWDARDCTFVIDLHERIIDFLRLTYHLYCYHWSNRSTLSFIYDFNEYQHL